MDFRRYAIFYTPAPGPFSDFGTAWLGWDPVQGRDVPQPLIAGLNVKEITATPRKYGFHGTMKPPFALAEGQSEEALKAAFAGFCDTAAPVGTGALELGRMGGFLALKPAKPSEPLIALAADIVRECDRFRAPATAAEIARRRAAGLSPDQEEMLKQWGYPYVMQQARFHMTLTGRLSRAQGAKVMQGLRPMTTPLLGKVFKLDGVSLMGEDAAGMFHLIERRVLGG